MDRMPCINDDTRYRYEPEGEAEEIDPRTIAEANIAWIEDEWKSALEEDTYEAWNEIRMMCFGATQALVYGSGMHAERKLLSDIGNIAFENGLSCIRSGRYEGA